MSNRAPSPAQPSRTAPRPAPPGPSPVDVALGERLDWAAVAFSGLCGNPAAVAKAEAAAVVALRAEHEKRHDPRNPAVPRFDPRQVPAGVLQRMAGRDLYSRAFAMARGVLEAKTGLCERFRAEFGRPAAAKTTEKQAENPAS